MKKVGFLLMLVLALIPYAAFAEEYSLEDLYRLALERSETIKIAGEDVYIAELEKDRATAALIPKFSAFGSHTEYSEKKEGPSFITQPDNSTSWGLRLDQSLSLSGRELTALKISKETIVKSGSDLDNVKEEYLLTVCVL